MYEVRLYQDYFQNAHDIKSHPDLLWVRQH